MLFEQGDAPVRCEIREERTGAELVPEVVKEETGAIPVQETGEGDLHLEDYPGDDFEKVGSSHLRKPHKHHLPLFLNTL